MLTNYEPSYLKLIKNEGGYANIKGDSGGETVFGISRNNFPNWEGWQIVDTAKELAKAGHIKNIDSGLKLNARFQNMVQTFYYQNFWQKVAGNSLPAPLDFIIFDFAVNAGVKAGIKVLQRALGLVDDGIIGNQTKQVIENIKNVKSVVATLKNLIQEYYKSLNQPKFIKGWLARVDNNFKGLV